MPTAEESIGAVLSGFIPRPGGSCPILDPLASLQIRPELIAIYQSRIDALVNQLGKNIILEFDPVIRPCDNCIFDSSGNRSTGVYKPGGPLPFDRGRKCPQCKGDGTIKTANTRCIKCLIKWTPRDARQYGVTVTDPQAMVRTKGMLSDAHLIMRAKTAIMNADIAEQVRLRVRRIRGPIPVGLREDRYAITFWELVESD